jgi:predicted ATPase/DNA-binding XRE family transcriptional regulator
MEQHSFGDWLRLRRKALDLTREGLADRVGFSAATIRKIEAEERRPSVQIVERLADILDIPQDERTAFLRFARGDWKFAPTETIPQAPWRTATPSTRSNLPATTTSLVGRELEIDQVREYLLRKEIRLVTLVGPPGIGKTRLSLETARLALSDFPGGVFFVSLAPLDDPSLIAPVLVQALGYVEAKNLPAEKILIDGIGEKQMLILLDNCEHLIEDIAALTSDLLSACPHLKILATSRESLRLPGEWLYTIPALELPEASSLVEVETAEKFPALRLFAERGRAVRSDFALDPGNIQAVAAICAHLDGLPLAIELIAARVRWMSPPQLLERLQDQFVLTADGMRTVPARQKTLNDAIGWSYDLLSHEEQKLFACLSLFSGSFTLSAAESIFSEMFTEKTVSELVVSLSDKNLLQSTIAARGETRFSMLVTIRLFASQHLMESKLEGELRERHAAYFLELAEAAEKHIHGPDQFEWVDRLDIELDNFRAALEWCLSSRGTEKLLRLFAALGWTWLMRWSFSESRSWYHKIRSLPDLADSPAAYARVLNTEANQEWIAGNFDEARSMLEESQDICLGLGIDGERVLAEALYLLAMITRTTGGRRDIAASYCEQSFELYRRCGDRWGMAFARFYSGLVAKDAGDEVSALAWLEQSLDLFRQLGDRWGMARSSQLLGQLFLKQGLYEKARLYFDEHLRVDEGLGFKQGIVVALYDLGDLHRYQCQYDQAENYYEKSQSLCREYSLKIDRGYNLYSLGMLALQRNNYPLAMQFFTDYFKLIRRSLEKISACDFLTGSAAVAGGQDHPSRAARLFGAAQAIFETTDYRIPSFDRAEFDRHIQIARDQLGEKSFEALAAEGRAMTLEQAVDYALENQSVQDSQA